MEGGGGGGGDNRVRTRRAMELAVGSEYRWG